MDSPPGLEPLAPFVEIATYLNSLGVKAPAIQCHDLDQGYAVIDDFGDATFTRLLSNGMDEVSLYEGAAEVLAHLQSKARVTDIQLPDYDMSILLREVRLFTEWYLGVGGTPVEQTIVDAFTNVLSEVANRRETLVLLDYHVDNLMLRQDVSETSPWIDRLGVLDFQDARIGSKAYDVVSLLEDARRDVSEDAKEAFLATYFKHLPALDTDQFWDDYHLLGAQRHAKVLGIFRRLERRDNKPVYTKHLPRVAKLMAKSLTQPILAPVKDVLDRDCPDWASLTG